MDLTCDMDDGRAGAEACCASAEALCVSAEAKCASRRACEEGKQGCAQLQGGGHDAQDTECRVKIGCSGEGGVLGNGLDAGMEGSGLGGGSGPLVPRRALTLGAGGSKDPLEGMEALKEVLGDSISQSAMEGLLVKAAMMRLHTCGVLLASSRVMNRVIMRSPGC